MQITYTNDPTTDEYAALRTAVGWKSLSGRQLAAAVKNNAFAIVARDKGSAIGLARGISDGGYNFFITDVIVLPEYQGKGIGKALMTAVMDYIGSTFTAGETVLVNLMSSICKEGFYKRFGFTARPSENFGAGMTQFVAK